ncbi:hypothetical protein PR001_g13734, partial [Phytophthora rubi]
MKSTVGTGQATSEFIEHRRAGLERFLRKVVNHDEQRNSNFFSSFLECSIVELTALKAEAQRASSVNATSMPSVVQRTQMLNNWWGKTYQRMVENDTLNLFGSRSGAEDGEHGGAIGCERRRPGLARFRGQKAVKLKKLFLEFAQLQLRNSKELEKIVAQSATELETPLPAKLLYAAQTPASMFESHNSFGLDKNDAIGVTKSTASTQSPLAAAAPTSYPRRRRPSPPRPTRTFRDHSV